MVTLFATNERDRYGVYYLADQISRLQAKCAFAFGPEDASTEVLNLAARAIEGVAFNAMITLGVTNLAAFVDPGAVVLSGPVFNVRVDHKAVS